MITLKVCAEATLASGTFTSSSGVTAGAASDSVAEGATGVISATEESVVPDSTGVVESAVGCSVLGVVGVSFDDSVVDSVVVDESVVGCSVVPGVVSVVGVSTASFRSRCLGNFRICWLLFCCLSSHW